VPVEGFVSDPDLILHYTFDEGTGTRVWDAAPSGNNHATDVTGAQWIPDGRFGGAYGPSSLSGNLFDFTPANQGDLNFNPRGDAYTLAVWVRTTAASGYNTVLGKDRGAAPWESQYRIWMNGSPNGIQGINGNQYGGTLNITSIPLNNGQWHLLTLVNFLDGSTWRTRLYYDNGTLVGQFNTGNGGVMPGLLRVGDTTQGGNSWVGQLDDLRIYRRALTQTEIATLYTAPDTETFQDWRTANLTPAQLGNPELNGPQHDANGNGLANALEFALGSSNISPQQQTQPCWR
jgi:hypothetical protein